MRPSFWVDISRFGVPFGIKDISILHNDRFFIGINKPYRLPLYSNKNSKSSVEALLPDISKLLNCSGISILDDGSLTQHESGSLLLAKNQEARDYFKWMIENNKISEKYLTILIKTPEIYKAEIKMTLINTNNESNTKNTLKIAPEYLPLSEIPNALPDYVKLAVTSYYIASVQPPPPSLNCPTYRNYEKRPRFCLASCLPETHIKDQIRVHLAQMLGCPVLGDHIYGSKNNSVQSLNRFQKKLLQLKTESSIISLPLFLHLSELSFLSLENKNKQIRLTSPFPPHFERALELLHINLPNR